MQMDPKAPFSEQSLVPSCWAADTNGVGRVLDHPVCVWVFVNMTGSHVNK